jgi:hypothetical protein
MDWGIPVAARVLTSGEHHASEKGLLSEVDQQQHLQGDEVWHAAKAGRRCGAEHRAQGRDEGRQAQQGPSEADEMKPGLYANIAAKRKRIAEGSGEKMRKPGTKGAPTAKAFRESAKTAKKK